MRAVQVQEVLQAKQVEVMFTDVPLLVVSVSLFHCVEKRFSSLADCLAGFTAVYSAILLVPFPKVLHMFLVAWSQPEMNFYNHSNIKILQTSCIFSPNSIDFDKTRIWSKKL